MNPSPGDAPPPVGHSACLGLGSNADPESNLPRALARLGRVAGVRVDAVSAAWQSAAVGTGGPDYLNAAAIVTTRLTREGLKSRLRQVETDLGRDRVADSLPGAVAIDLDLIVFDAEILEPGLWDLAYRAVPVAELLPDLASPATGEPLSRAALRLARSTRIEPRPEVLPGPGARAVRQAAPS